jgi:signal peptidase II
MRAFLAYGGLGLAALAIDQWIKYLVETRLPMQEPVDVLPFLAWFRTYNTGISFSWLSGMADWQLIAMALAVTLFIGWLAWRSPPRQVFARAGFALIVGGAVGNLIDRVALGHVVDYVLFHTPVWSFAVFNLADACITVGAMLVIVQEVVDWRRGDAGDAAAN